MKSLNGNTSRACETCGATNAVMVPSWNRIGKRLITWLLCVGCEIAERKAAE